MFRTLPLVVSVIALTFAAPLRAQDTPSPEDQVEQEDNSNDMIVVTGSMRVRQGGAQDAGHFRASSQIGMPRPESLTVEGLMGEHDLDFTGGKSCAQLFCLVTEAKAASLPLRPDDRYFVGLGFGSNVDAATWKREPLNLIAVVDKSGSMDGQPLDLVRKSLAQIVGQMRPGDRIAIVLYGDRSHVYLEPTDAGANRADVLRAISAIKSEGSTNMEAGLKVGYDLAFATRPAFRGNTRMMLFTDEQPNVGATDAESFMGMAEEASRRGIGLTTVGVGVQYDGELATKIGSVRGGNLYFIANPGEVKSVFSKKLDTMVSELAHDVRIRMAPPTGYKISGVFGVPGELMTDSGDGVVTVTVPTAFLSTNGGGIFVTLGRETSRRDLPAVPLIGGQPILSTQLTYVDARTGRAAADQIVTVQPSGDASPVMRKAELLVDEFLVLREASTVYHRDNQPKRSFALLNDLSTRMKAQKLDGLGQEQKLVDRLRTVAAFYSGYGGEQPKSSALAPLKIEGRWAVISADGMKDVVRGDIYEFDDGYLMTTSRKGDDDGEDYELNDHEIRLTDSNIVFEYSISGDSLLLSHADGFSRIRLKRLPDEATS